MHSQSVGLIHYCFESIRTGDIHPSRIKLRRIECQTFVTLNVYIMSSGIQLVPEQLLYHNDIHSGCMHGPDDSFPVISRQLSYVPVPMLSLGLAPMVQTYPGSANGPCGSPA